MRFPWAQSPLLCPALIPSSAQSARLFRMSPLCREVSASGCLSSFIYFKASWVLGSSVPKGSARSCVPLTWSPDVAVERSSVTKEVFPKQWQWPAWWSQHCWEPTSPAVPRMKSKGGRHDSEQANSTAFSQATKAGHFFWLFAAKLWKVCCWL